MRLIAYIDDIVVLAESKELTVSHVEAVVYHLRFPEKPKEISVGASTDHGIPWPNSGHCGRGIETSTRENEKDSCGVMSHGKS